MPQVGVLRLPALRLRLRWPLVLQPQMLQELAVRPQVLGLVVLCVLGLRLLVLLLLARHVLDFRPRILQLLVLQPRMLQAMELWPQVLGLVVPHVLGLRLRVLPLLVRPLTVLWLLVLWRLELRGPGLWPLWWLMPQVRVLTANASSDCASASGTTAAEAAVAGAKCPAVGASGLLACDTSQASKTRTRTGTGA